MLNLAAVAVLAPREDFADPAGPFTGMIHRVDEGRSVRQDPCFQCIEEEPERPRVEMDNELIRRVFRGI